jgi:AraC-like DNA-binding protein
MAASFAAADRIDRRLPPRWHALVASGDVVSHLRDLLLPCCIIPESDRDVWMPIWSTDASIASFEVPFGGEAARSAYNARCLEEVHRTRRPLISSFRGFCDLFVPILGSKKVEGYLASGPFCREPVTAASILDRFRELTGREPQRDDPDLLRYAEAVVSVPVLEGSLLSATTAYLVELARALGGSIDFAQLNRRHVSLRRRYFHGHLHADMATVARGLVDPVSHGFWSANFRKWDRQNVGLDRLPTVVIAVAPATDHDRDALEALVSARRFAKICYDVAFSLEETVCGRTAGGVVYLLAYVEPTPAQHARGAALRQATVVRKAIERVAGFSIRLGISSVMPDARELPRCLEQATRALEWAAHKRRPQVLYDDEARRRADAQDTIFDSLPVLVRAVGDGERAVMTRTVEHLASEIVWQAGSSVVAARAYAEIVHSQVARALRGSAVLEPRTLRDLVAKFGPALADAANVGAVAATFAAHVVALADARSSSVASRRDRRLLRATAYIDEHLAEQLTLHQVARTAGYADDYFSRLLRARHGRTFEQYLLARRIARAKELLRTTTLTVAQIAVASGFRTEAYFYRAFRAGTGRTPHSHRRWSRKPGILASRIADKSRKKVGKG